MSSHLRLGVFASILLTVGLGLVTAEADRRGPFPIERSPIDNMSFTFKRKLEAPTQALDLTSHGMLVDGQLILDNEVKVVVPDVDPATGLGYVDEQGNPLMKEVIYPAGTILDPANNPADNILIPKGVTVSSQALANGTIEVGRFGYLGVVPRFDSKDLEMVASKMGHTLRVKAFITQDTLDTYEFQLLSKFKDYSDMLAKQTIHLVPVRSLKKMAATTTNNDLKKWYTVAAMYGKHLYDDSSLDLYAAPRTEAEYKQTILTMMIRTYLNNPNATIESGVALYNSYKADPSFQLSRRSESAALFYAHFKDNFVSGAPVAPLYPIEPMVTPKPLPSGAPSPIPEIVPTPVPSIIPPVPHSDALGYLTFVYPIAIDKAGPFQLPSPGFRKFPLSSSVEGRWYSNRWLGEFGGFPFIQITSDGVAFHGPITMSSDGETWYLRRDNVSHSCMRMDPSDLMELRALLPKNMNNLQKLGQTVPLWIIEWPDVTDLDNNGTHEVVDVAYYSLPTDGSAIKNPANWAPELYNKIYWNRMFSPYVKAKKLKRKNTFTITSVPGTDPVTGAATTTNVGTFTGLPKYELVNGVIKIVGLYTEPLPIRTMPQRPTQIIQYREDGTKYENADLDGADRWGSYPPTVVNKFGKRRPTDK